MTPTTKSRTEIAAFVMLGIGLVLMGLFASSTTRSVAQDVPPPYQLLGLVFVIDAYALYRRSKYGYWLFWPLAALVGAYVLLVLAAAVYTVFHLK